MRNAIIETEVEHAAGDTPRAMSIDEADYAIARRLAVLGFRMFPSPDEWMRCLDDADVLALFGVVEDRISAGIIDEADACDSWSWLCSLRAQRALHEIARAYRSEARH